ncbi:MAG: transcription antitermination factor NusB [Alphaproteobacteria bacterium]|nr:transcription antitermination factor NusB [Alphaproteobacteria bacterium]
MPEKAAAVSDGLAARQVAFAVLNDIFFQRRSLDEAYAQAEGALAALESRDRGFVRLLVATVLKRAPQMDAALAALLHEPLENLKPQQLINVLRLGMAQIVFLQTPAHAAVSTAVDLAAAAGIEWQKSLVNAVMRRIAQEGIAQPDAREAGRINTHDAGRINTPDWLWQQWVNDYGVETALDIAAANLADAPVDFTVKENPDIWAERLGAALLPSGALRLPTAGFVPGLAGFDDGAWWVQNAAAALPVKFLAAYFEGDLRGKKIVDLCAAPGGKTAQLAALGADVIALDRSAPRLLRLRENMTRLKLDVETIAADGAVWQPLQSVDAVLLDAPCSATGTIRHQPDVLRLKDMRDQDKLAGLQRRLMVNAMQMLKPGGVMVYCTCSIQKAEGEAQTDWLLAQNTGAALSPIYTGEVAGIGIMLTTRGELRALPQHWSEHGGIDGFYAARFVKNG